MGKLDKGFLFDKNWERPLRKLKPNDFALLFWELYDFQDSKGEKTVGEHINKPYLDDLSDLILPQIQNRLDGQRGGQASSQSNANRGNTGGTVGGAILKISQDKLREDKISQEECRPSAKVDTDIYQREFDSLWTIYPNKKGKAQALQAYIKARKQGESFEAVENGINSYIQQIQALKTKPEYVKHGSTWFSQNAWNDEYTTNNTPAYPPSELDEVF